MAHMTNPLVTAEQLYRRNNLSLLPNDLQDIIFYMTQCLTQAAGVLLQLPQSDTAHANVVLARYWLAESRSLLATEFSDVSAACIFLTTKLGPHPRTPRDISNVYAYLLSPASAFMRDSSGSSSSSSGSSSATAAVAAAPAPPADPAAYCCSEAAYAAFHSRVLALEGRILHALAFDTHVALPHALAVTYLQALEYGARRRAAAAAAAALAARAVAHLNTALLSPQLLYLTHQPGMLAVAAVYSAAGDVGARMPRCEWWEVFDVEREELGFLVVAMRSLEGWVRQRREECPWMGSGMVTRATVRAELEKRGVWHGNGVEEDEDEEAAMMRMMDEKAAEMEAQS